MTAPAWKARPRWQQIGAVLLIFAVLLALSAWIASIVLRPHLPTHDEVVAQSRAEAKLTGGARAFATHCAACHTRNIGPALGGRGLDAAAIDAFVRNGPGAMPAFSATQVGDADIAAISVYLATLPPTEEQAK